MKISEMITDRYKLRIPPTVYYELLADVQEVEEEQELKFIAKSDGTIEQIKNCNDCLFKKEWEKIGKLLSVVLEKQTEQEPKRGHWIVDAHRIRAFGSKNETHVYSVHCDKCNYVWDYTIDKKGSLVSNFCPNCGADMRKVEK